MRFGVTSPSREEFARRSTSRSCPVTRRLLADSETAVGIYRKLAGNRPGTVLLESAEQGKRWARYSFVGRAQRRRPHRARRPHRMAGRRRARAHRRPAGRPAGRRPDAGPADADAAGRRPAAADRRAGRLPRVRRRPPAGAAARDQRRRPRHARARDDAGHRPRRARPHRRHGPADRQRAARRSGGYDDAVTRLDAMAADLTKAVPPGVAVLETGRGAAGAAATWRRASSRTASSGSASTSGPATPSRSCWRSGSSWPTDVDALDLYRVLRATNPSPYMYLLRFAGRESPFDVVGSSPEALVTVTGSVGRRPPAGRHPPARGDRGGGRAAGRGAARRPEGARRARDAGRPGPQRPRPGLRARAPSRCPTSCGSSTTATSCTWSRRWPARSPPEHDALDVFDATFPAGTVSGAPKPRAMEIIESLEPTRRALYAGTVGYVDASGDMDMAIAIRTAVLHQGRRLRAGRRRDRGRQRPGHRGGRDPAQGAGGAVGDRDGGGAAGAPVSERRGRWPPRSSPPRSSAPSAPGALALFAGGQAWAQVTAERAGAAAAGHRRRSPAPRPRRWCRPPGWCCWPPRSPCSPCAGAGRVVVGLLMAVAGGVLAWSGAARR